MEHDLGAVVIDAGSSALKAGFAGENHPRCVMSPAVGRPRHHLAGAALDGRSFVGERLTANEGRLDVSVPVEHGVVTDWPDLERLWQHVFAEELRVDPSDYRVLVTETPLNPRANRAKTVEVLFESLNADGVHLASQPVLALYASGRTSGLVLDCGHGVTHWVPVVEGHSLPAGIARMGYGGRDVDHFLRRLLVEQGYFLFGDRDRDALRRAKETLCYVAPDEEEEFRRTQGDAGETLALPDGTAVHLASERFRSAELLFRPKAAGLDSAGVGEAALLALEHCPAAPVRHRLCDNVVLSGGSTLFQGFKERVEKELSAAAADAPDVKVVAPPNRKYAAWVGGALVAAISAFQPLWITRDEYEDQGPRIVFRKCF